MIEIAGSPAGLVDGPHSACTDPLTDPVGSDPFGWRSGVCQVQRATRQDLVRRVRHDQFGELRADGRRYAFLTVEPTGLAVFIDIEERLEQRQRSAFGFDVIHRAGNSSTRLAAMRARLATAV